MRINLYSTRKRNLSLSYRKAFAGNMASVEGAVVAKEYMYSKYSSLLKKAKTTQNYLIFNISK